MDILPCSIKHLPSDMRRDASLIACAINPVNHAPVSKLRSLGLTPTPNHLALLTSTYWSADGVHLTVGFMENPDPALQRKIVQYANNWGKYGNVTFTLISNARQADVRVSLQSGGYWSYLGTDIRSVPNNQQTMNLEAFSMSTPDSEFLRVVQHEFGHTLGFPHEHLRRELVALLDARKVIIYFMQTQGWSREDVIQQVLTPLEDSQLMETPRADPASIMAYQIPGFLTLNGQGIVGGTDIDPSDQEFVAKVYPKSPTPPPPPPKPPSGGVVFSFPWDGNVAGPVTITRPTGG